MKHIVYNEVELTTDEILKKTVANEMEMAFLLSITVRTLRNRISRGENHPPFCGAGKSKRFYLNDFFKWDRQQKVREIRSA